VEKDRAVHNGYTRRTFIGHTLKALSLFALLLEPLFSGVNSVWAYAKKTVIPRGASRQNFIDKNPAELDSSNMDVTPLAEFGTMGLDDYQVDLEEWRLVVDGKVEKPLSLKYSEILDLPSIEKTVLMVCPGVFVNNGTWKGISILELLKRAQVKDDAAYVTLRGPRGNYEKVERYSLNDSGSDQLFLAYQVNGTTLPRKHGYPLRLVAEGRYGSEWVKYVWNVKVD
jgi:DMSO/TMAO reductase YedYZ molybdopterin-dependent catalytic subunit